MEWADARCMFCRRPMDEYHVYLIMTLVCASVFDYLHLCRRWKMCVIDPCLFYGQLQVQLTTYEATHYVFCGVSVQLDTCLFNGLLPPAELGEAGPEKYLWLLSVMTHEQPLSLLPFRRSEGQPGMSQLEVIDFMVSSLTYFLHSSFFLGV